MNAAINVIRLMLACHFWLIFTIANSNHVSGQETSVAGWPHEVRAIKYLSSADETMQPSLFYDPGGNDLKPLLIALHSWSGDYTQANPAYGIWCIAKKWVLMHSDFRGVNQRPEACGSELAVQDIVSAVEYAKKNCKIDENRIYLIGASGGGNEVAALKDRVSKATILEMVKAPEMPVTLLQKIDDALYQRKPALFRRVSGSAQVTIFQGGHEIIYEAGLGWLEQQRKGKQPVWEIREVPTVDITKLDTKSGK